jgi:hypothetical protein
MYPLLSASERFPHLFSLCTGLPTHKTKTQFINNTLKTSLVLLHCHDSVVKASFVRTGCTAWRAGWHKRKRRILPLDSAEIRTRTVKQEPQLLPKELGDFVRYCLWWWWYEDEYHHSAPLYVRLVSARYQHDAPSLKFILTSDIAYCLSWTDQFSEATFKQGWTKLSEREIIKKENAFTARKL